MFISQISSNPNKQINKLKPVDIACNHHPGSVCLNYCLQPSCFKMLCEQCIEEHLNFHKNSGIGARSIKSLKRVREVCTEKLVALIDQLEGRMLQLKQPKSPQQIMDDVNLQFEAVKKIMYEIVEQELCKFYDELKGKVNESFSMIKNLQQVYGNLSKLIGLLENKKQIIIEGSHQISQKVQEVLSLDQNQYLQTFARQTSGFSQKLTFVEFNLSINQNKLRGLIKQCLKIGNNHSQNKFQSNFQQPSKSNISRALSEISLNIPSRILNETQKSNSKHQVALNLTSPIKTLHFFQCGSSHLHLFNLSSPKNIKKESLNLGSNYIIPSFHASLLSTHSYIFISGGLIEIGDSEMKCERISRYGIQGKCLKGSEGFCKDFAKGKPRSSHSLCQYGDYIYILGGYGCLAGKDQIQIDRTVEKLHVQTGEIEYETKSKFGGANMSLVISNGIMKASEQGVQFFDFKSRKWSQIPTPQHYSFTLGCGWTKISKESVMVYGGYENDEKSLDTCNIWTFSDGSLQIKRMSFKLPYEEGFLNNPGIIVDSNLYVLQNVCVQNDEDQSGDVHEGERALLEFNGETWRHIEV